jgi:hypothetical protein
MKKIILFGVIFLLITGCDTSIKDSNKAADVVKNKFQSSGTIVCYSQPYTVGGKEYKQVVSKQEGWSLVSSDRSLQGYIFKKDIEEYLPSECAVDSQN